MKHWLILENKRQYESAINRVEVLMELNPRPSTDIGKELKLLLFLIEKFEDEHYPIGLPDPIEAIKIRMEELGLDTKDLLAVIGDKGTVSKILNRKISLSLNMIRKLNKLLQLPLEVLIQEQKLAAA